MPIASSTIVTAGITLAGLLIETQNRRTANGKPESIGDDIKRLLTRKDAAGQPLSKEDRVRLADLLAEAKQVFVDRSIPYEDRTLLSRKVAELEDMLEEVNNGRPIARPIRKPVVAGARR